MATIIKLCRGGKKSGEKAIDGFKKKIRILDSEICVCPEFEVKSGLN